MKKILPSTWTLPAILALFLFTPGGLLLPMCRADEVADLIAQLDSKDKQKRLQAVDKLAEVKDRRVAEPLMKLLDLEIKDDAEREELWLRLAQALSKQASNKFLDEKAIPRLEKLAHTEAKVRINDFMSPSGFPKYEYQNWAYQAISKVRFNKAEATMQAGLAGLDEKGRIAFLADKAWKTQEKNPDSLQLGWLAYKELPKYGVKGLEPSLASISKVEEGPGQRLVEYLVDLYKTSKDPRCVNGLLELAKSPHVMVWQEALAELTKLKDKAAVKPLLNILKEQKDKSPLFLSMGIMVLGKTGDEQAIPYFISMLGHANPDVRVSANESLAAIGKPAVPELVKALKSEDREVRLGAVGALVKIDDPRRNDPLKDFLKKYPDEYEFVIELIKKALGP